MAITFSVVIPTRGRVEMLQRALASVSEQTEQDFEILVVDDLSQAKAATEIAELVGRTPQARLLLNECNLGAPASRNRGIAASRGAIVATLDSDDWWAPDRLARHKAAHVGSNAVLSYNPTIMVGPDGSAIGRPICNAPPPVSGHSDRAVAMWNFLGGCSNVCFDRDLFERVGGFRTDLPSCQDWDLWFRMAQSGGQVVYVADTLTYQDWGDHERISTTRGKVDDGHERIFALINSASWRPNDRRLIAAHHQRVRARIEMDFGNGPGAIVKAGTSLLIRPNWRALYDMASFGKRTLLTLMQRFFG